MTGGDTITQTYLAIEGMHSDERNTLLAMLDEAGYFVPFVEVWLSNESGRDELEIADLEAEIKRLKMELHRVAYQPLADRLLRLRRASRLNTRELAARSGVSTASISLIECGKHRRPGKKLLTKLAAALGVSVEALASNPHANDQPQPSTNGKPLNGKLHAEPTPSGKPGRPPKAKPEEPAVETPKKRGRPHKQMA